MIMKNKIAIIVSSIFVIGLIMIGLSAKTKTSLTSSENIVPQTNLKGDISNQAQLSDFSLEKLGGGTITLSEFRDKKPVVVNFWASWCPNCQRDMPKLNGYYEKYKNDVEVIGVDIQESQSVVQDFVDSHKIMFPIALDKDGRVSEEFDIQYTNMHLLVNKEGIITRVVTGDIKESDIKSLIQ